ncbi:PREDICTED: protein CHAPERONE-LIKE PROTEIN OF POR1, chloroplastic-like [Tarenaya hassleriana]|uniref:protein CHAPERONE-LIKE PROTEIN OF POR1, chloroplastic-like n=1 Tax=Tarenaya hassleriana TaxID=28532 RepID=UPI00053C1B36|nr:PREDICTED: protein CHAPERONE-LIKE PROTEIN OF POR1, chloroplastic-like [Tarenaya hassleriana]
MATASLSLRQPRLSPGSNLPLAPVLPPYKLHPTVLGKSEPWRSVAILPSRRRCAAVRTSSRADDSAPLDMSLETALKVLGVSEGASFEDILRAKNSIIASCNGDPNAVAQAEAAYDMLLMQSLNQRRAGKVVNKSIRYADVKPSNVLGTGPVSQWMQATAKNPPVSIETPSTSDLGLQAGVYGALMILTYVNGSSTESSTIPYAGADVPGLILASSFGASLYFMTRRNVKLGKAAAITVGGLVAGAIVGSAIESWLQVDVVPFLGLHSPPAVVGEFIIISQFLVSLCLR